jgi:hypothetical protein
MAEKSKEYVPTRYPANIKDRIKNSKKFKMVKVPLDTVPESVYKGTYRRNDYPQVWYEGRSQGAHVVAWKKAGRKIPKGYIVHHKNNDKTNKNPKLKDLALMKRSDHARMSGGYRPNKDSSPQSEEKITTAKAE